MRLSLSLKLNKLYSSLFELARNINIANYQRVNHCAEEREEDIDARKDHKRGEAERFLDCQGQLQANLEAVIKKLTEKEAKVQSSADQHTQSDG
jgi:hypothetical protein